MIDEAAQIVEGAARVARRRQKAEKARERHRHVSKVFDKVECEVNEAPADFHVNGIHPAPDIHEHFTIHKGYGKLRTSSRTTSTTWSTLRTIARTPQCTLTRTLSSSEHAAHRL